MRSRMRNSRQKPRLRHQRKERGASELRRAAFQAAVCSCAATLTAIVVNVILEVLK
jgi:hypothetical protein